MSVNDLLFRELQPDSGDMKPSNAPSAFGLRSPRQWPGDEFEIKQGRKQIQLIPLGVADEE